MSMDHAPYRAQRSHTASFGSHHKMASARAVPGSNTDHMMAAESMDGGAVPESEVFASGPDGGGGGGGRQSRFSGANSRTIGEDILQGMHLELRHESDYHQLFCHVSS